MLTFPDIDPVIFQIGPFALRWYALAYLAGLLIGWRLIVRLAGRPDSPVTPKQADDFLIWAALGVILGGRLGYVIFYKPGYYLENPGDILAVWQGGMSFHGGLLGVVAALLLHASRNRLGMFDLSDLVAQVAPIGLFFGRIANFINAELWGRPSDVPWAMVFPNGGPNPRHPSQLYEAFLEGIVLYLVLYYAAHKMNGMKRAGWLTGLFLVGYSLARIVAEFFREPDAHLGFLFAGATMGQLLSLPMLAVGVIFMAMSRRRRTRRAA
ncbi:MAG: prolipoprotein diacylglyceryl transferase [Alphaproteobacteria bacterium]|nr:prolipoprotein diacylglyceryl transferase [Alphaproteobacteria bacterium]